MVIELTKSETHVTEATSFILELLRKRNVKQNLLNLSKFLLIIFTFLLIIYYTKAHDFKKRKSYKGMDRL